MIRMPRALPMGAVASFKVEQWALQGWAMVRHCLVDEGGEYLVGLEYVDDLRWVPDDHEGRLLHDNSAIPVENLR